MASFLYRLGRFSYTRRRLVAAVWVAALALLGFGAVTMSQPMSTAISIPGTESQKALDLLAERMPAAAAGTASARVVFVAPEGSRVTNPAVRSVIENTIVDLAALPDVAGVGDPYTMKTISADGSTALAQVTYQVKATDLTDADHEALIATADAAESAGVAVDFTGDAASANAEAGSSELIGLGVAAVVLFITFWSLISAGLPILTALIGVGFGMLGIQLATKFADVSSTTPTLAIMLGLAVGIDYALLIVSRYRHELLEGRTPDEAAGRAVGTAGSAVVFAGSTVVIALAGLSVVGIPFLTTMGIAAAATVAVAVIVAITLLPAMLGFAGRRIISRKGRGARDTEHDTGKAPMGEKWSRFVLRHRWIMAAGVVIGLGALAIPVASLHTGMPSDASASIESTQRQAYDATAKAFGPGFNGPLLIAVDLADAPDRMVATEVIAADLAEVSNVAYVSPAQPNKAGDMAIISVIPSSGPDEAATETLVHDIRGQAADWQQATGASVAVTGTTAVMIDISEKLNSALPTYVGLIVGLALLLMMLVFRSILVPIKAVLGFLLSMGAALGSVVAVFQWGHLGSLFGVDTPGPIISFLPIFLVGGLFGLAMDYEVFLVSRMREEHVHGATANESVALGFRHGARVVTAAAIIMISVFGAFMTSGDAVIKSIGFGLAIGVLFDAFLVRMTLVPAVMSMLGSKAWWLPRWLDRILPNVDIEGEKLTRTLDTADSSSSTTAETEDKQLVTVT